MNKPLRLVVGIGVMGIAVAVLSFFIRPTESPEEAAVRKQAEITADKFAAQGIVRKEDFVNMRLIKHRISKSGRANAQEFSTVIESIKQPWSGSRNPSFIRMDAADALLLITEYAPGQREQVDAVACGLLASTEKQDHYAGLRCLKHTGSNQCVGSVKSLLEDKDLQLRAMAEQTLKVLGERP